MATLNTQFEAELKKLLNERVREVAAILCDGQAIKDYADYRQYVGQLIALKQIDDFCDQVNTTLNTR